MGLPPCLMLLPLMTQTGSHQHPHLFHPLFLHSCTENQSNDMYSRCSKIWKTSCLPKMVKTNSADPDQTASEEAV